MESIKNYFVIRSTNEKGRRLLHEKEISWNFCGNAVDIRFQKGTFISK
jgi:hypothetical protein